MKVKILNRVGAMAALASLLLAGSLAKAQDADKQKLMEIEKAFADITLAGPNAAALFKQYLYDGTVVEVTGHGLLGALPKARIVEYYSMPDPSDPDVKSKTVNSNYQIEIYGETAMVGYKVTNTDVGHKEAALNATERFGCLDTFVKRNGQWLMVANACTPSAPLPMAEWTATKKAVSQQPKDIQNAYH